MTATNRIILGLMTFGPSDGGASHAKVHDQETFASCLDEFQSHGYNEIDTARVYCSGKQEAFTTAAGYKERGLTIATKCYPRYKGSKEGHTRDALLGKLEESLRELGTDCVDIFYLHAPDRTTPFYETLEAINEAYRQGKFKTFGISNFTAAEVAEVCTIAKYNNFIRPTLYQGAYNLINRTPEYDLLPTLRRHGLDWVVYNPLAGGMLTGRWLGMGDEKTGRFAGEGVAEIYGARYWKEQTFEALNLVNDAAMKHDIPMAEIALRWIQHHSSLKMRSEGGNDGIIIGASSLTQLQQNMANFAKGPLPQDILDVCEEAWSKMAGARPPYYHGKYEYGYDTVEALYGEGAR